LPNRADAAGTVRVELPKKEWERQKACYTEVMPKLLKRPGRKAAATRGTVARANPRSEDEALNGICDQRLNEPRYAIDKLLKRWGMHWSASGLSHARKMLGTLLKES
jgi:hypothetical protein